MKYFKYYILPIAVTDFNEAKEWYKSKKIKGLSKRFAQAIKEAIEKISTHPTAFAIRYKNTRIIHTEKFPYAIHFFVDDNRVVITAIIFNRRDTQNIQKRENE